MSAKPPSVGSPTGSTSVEMISQSLTTGTSVFIDTFLGVTELERRKLEQTEYEARWLSGKVVNVDGERSEAIIELDENNETVTAKFHQLFLKNPTTIDSADDITTLPYLHEIALLNSLTQRYHKQMIYTYVGTILIAINPYMQLAESMYGRETINAYQGVPLGKLSPHVFAIAEEAYRSMLTENVNQSILVSGESGAGKTETTKFLLKYFAAMGKKSNREEKSIEQQVLSSTPLLEAFGNAKTLRNDNSSRFGKFIEIQFNDYGAIVGATIRTYLLEKSRIIRQSTGERNYHIFYQLLAGADAAEKAELSLTSAEEYTYLNQSGCIDIEGVDDKDVYEETCAAMTTIGITKEEQKAINRILAAVLHIGNIQFNKKDETCEIIDPEGPLRTACSLLGLDEAGIQKTLLTRNITAGREAYTVGLTKEQAETARDALAMLLYSKMFDWIVKRMNEKINCSNTKHFIGVLDIYGFESFDNNSFEQFCINFANEKLQQQYNQHIFKLSQQEYIKEKIEWSTIEFNDNQACLDLIEGAKLCVLALLDEECRFPKANEKTFAEKLYKNHTSHPHFEKPRFGQTHFTIKHYADSVTYDTTSFLDKNKDFIVAEQLALLEKSSFQFLANIFKAFKQAQMQQAQKKPGGPGQSSSFQFSSVSSQFKDSLAALMETINKTYPHYIRCIKPNWQKKPGIFNLKMVLNQLKCGGILESIRICLEGYPYKKPYHDFFERYKTILPAIMKLNDPRKGCEELLKHLEIEQSKYQFGLTKLFIRAGQVEKIEKIRTSKLNFSAANIQKNVRRMIARKMYRRVKEAANMIQNAVRVSLDKAVLRMMKRMRAATIIQKNGRQYLARKIFADRRQKAIAIQRAFRAHLSRRKMHKIKKQLLSVQVVQAWARGYLIRKVYKEMVAEARSLATIQKQKQGLELKVEELQYQLNSEARVKTKIEEKYKHVERELEEKAVELKELERSSTLKYSEYDREINQLRQENKELNSQLSKEREAKAKLGQANEALQNEVAELKKLLAQQTSSSQEKNKDYEAIIEKLRKELEEEKKNRSQTSRRLTSMQEEKAKIKLRKKTEMGWEVDRALSCMIGERQEQAERFVMFLLFESHPEIVNNQVPVPAFLIYNLMYHCRDLQFDRVTVLVANSLRAAVASSQEASLPYWLSNCAHILELFGADDFADAKGNAITCTEICDKISAALKGEQYVNFDDAVEEPEVEADASLIVKFLSQASFIFVKTYCTIVQSGFKRLEPMLKTCLNFDDMESSRGRKIASFHDILAVLQATYNALKEAATPPPVLAKLIIQLINFIDYSLFNEILLRKDLCSSAKSIQIKLNIVLLEQEVSNWLGREVTLAFVRQAVSLLLMNKNLLLNVEIRRDTIPNLNSAQINKLLQMYTASEFEEPVSEQVFSFFSKPQKPCKEPEDFQNTDLFLKTKSITAFSDYKEIASSTLLEEVQYISFPISVKDRCEKLVEQRNAEARAAAQRKAQEAEAAASAVIASAQQAARGRTSSIALTKKR